jgi:serine/threonine-protein kinase
VTVKAEVKPDAETLRRLSPLLDQVLDLEAPEREAWLAGLAGSDAELIPLLRKLLSPQSVRETGDILLHRPDFAALGQELAAPAEFAAGDAIGPYRLLRELGRGGMGDVWLAERADGTLKREVALKLPVLGLRRNVLMQRFERERDILGALTHANIAHLYDAGLADDGQPYLALEYVAGEPITPYAEHQALDLPARVKLLRQAMDAVQYAHANLVIHRDLKPSNLLVTDQGKVMLLDFGIAKLLEDDAVEAHETELTQLGGKALTLHYAAPEQLGSGPISIAVDVWALGVLLYELACGQRPFSGHDRSALQRAILADEPARPSRRGGALAGLPAGLRTDLDTIILKALKKSPAERYPTVSAFADDLDRWLDGRPVLAQKDSTWYRARKFIGRHHWAAAATAAALLASAGFVFSLDAQVRKVTRERDRADRIAQFMTNAFKVADPSQENSGKITARELLDGSVANLDRNLANDPETRARLVRTMGRAYSSLGALAQSEALLTKEYDRAKKDLGDDHPATLSLGAELVTALYMNWKLKPAERLARDIIERQRRVLGPEDYETSVTESHLAGLLVNEGQFDEAIELHSHSLAVSRRQTNTDPLALLDEESNLAFLRLKVGKAGPQEAERLFREQIEGYRQRYGPTNLKTLVTISELAIVLDMGKRFDEEIALLLPALRDGKTALGAEHPRMRDLANNLAAAYINKGDLAGAAPILRESIAVNERVEGADSPRAAIGRFNLACVQARRGQKEDALALLDQALHHGLIADAALSMAGEDDLASLRGELKFTRLVAEANRRYRQIKPPAAPSPDKLP